MKDFTALGAYIFAGGFTLGVSRHLRVMARAVLPPVGDYVGRVVRAGLEAGVPAEPSVRVVDHLAPAEELMKRKREALKVERNVKAERERYDWTLRDLPEDPPKPPASPRGLGETVLDCQQRGRTRLGAPRRLSEPLVASCE